MISDPSALPQYHFGRFLRPHCLQLFFLICLISTTFSTKNLQAQNVVINEVQASNNKTIADEDGDFEDWIELYNPQQDTVWLQGYGLSDTPENLYRWVFPKGSYIAPSDFLLIIASGKDRRNPEAPLHTNFRIRSEGEPLFLSSFTIPEGHSGPVLDHLPPTPIPSDYSYGRYPDGTDEWRLFLHPTPGEPNQYSPYRGITPEPEFSYPPGFYSEAFDLTLTSSFPDAVIHYTTNGSAPTTESPVYQSPIRIESKADKPNILSNIVTGPQFWQKPEGNIFKGMPIRAMAVREGYLKSKIIGGTWFIDPEAANRYPFPVVSLLTDSLHLFSSETGIMVPGDTYDPENPFFTGNYIQRGDAWERPVHIDFFDHTEKQPVHLKKTSSPGTLFGKEWTGGANTDSNGPLFLAFSQKGGLRIHGGATRRYPQKSLRLYARSEYDWHPDFSYPILPGNRKSGSGEPVERYKRLILRSSGDDWLFSFFRDAMAQSLITGQSIDTQAYRPSIVFINGEFWGIHHIRERFDSWYFETHYDINREDVAILVNNAIINTGTASDRMHYLNMRNYATGHDLSVNEHFEHIKTLMDIESFLLFNTIHVYAANADWPHNNVRFWRKRTDSFEPNASFGLDGRWRWVVYDLDASFGFPYKENAEGWAQYDHDMIEWITGRGNPRVPDVWVNELFVALLDNEAFRNRFISHLAMGLNTRFSSNFVSNRIEAFRQAYRPVIDEHLQRYPRSIGGSREAWEENVDRMIEFAKKRPAFLRKHLMQHFDIADTVTLRLSVNNPEYGHVSVHGQPIHPDTPGVPENFSPWTGTWFHGIPVPITPGPHSGYRFVEWQDETGSPLISSESIHFDGTDLVWIPEENRSLKAVFKPEDISAEDEKMDGALQFRLGQNYPNPFNHMTTIPYSIPFRADVEIAIYTPAGRLVKKIKAGTQEAGAHTLRLDTGNLASGLYIYRLRARPDAKNNWVSNTQKMILIR